MIGLAISVDFGPGGQTHDLWLEIDHSHTGADLLVALLEWRNATEGAVTPAAPPAGLGLWRVGRDDNQRCVGIPPALPASGWGIVNGDHLRVGPVSDGMEQQFALHARPTAAGEVSLPGSELMVVSGPDVGLSYPIAVDEGPILVGRDPACDLVLHDPGLGLVELVFTPNSVDGQQFVGVERSPSAVAALAVNGDPVGSVPATVYPGDSISIASTTIRVATSKRPHRGPSPPASTDRGRIAVFRSPHHEVALPETHFEALGTAPAETEPIRFPYLIALAPLVMGVGLAFLYSPRFLVFIALSPLMALAGWMEQRRRVSQQFQRQRERFLGQVADRNEQVHRALRQERAVRVLRHPDLPALLEMARFCTNRLWERDPRSGTFLELRLGLGTGRSHISVAAETHGTDELLTHANETRHDADHIHHVPITVDLKKHGPLALVGDRRSVAEVATAVAVQASCLHSPEDVVIAGVLTPSSPLIRWIKWLPHAASPHSPLGPWSLATTAETSRRLVDAVAQVASRRMTAARASGDRPHPWIFLIIESEMAVKAGVTGELKLLTPEAGVVIVWVAQNETDPPQSARSICHCVPMIAPGDIEVHRGVSSLRFPSTTIGESKVRADRASNEFGEAVARALAPLEDITHSSAHQNLPARVDVAALLDGQPATAQTLESWWEKSQSTHSLVTPIGVTAGGVLRLDLVADGPHALVGGTSGAGKSELLTTMVAGLIAQNPPERLNLLFVDYKGGAAAEVFRPAPHTVGFVTNLDEGLALRALQSLRAELNRRMALLSGRAKDLTEMIRRHPRDAPPSLVIVVDEFATLVKEIPAFVDGMVDIAQRGRSLGIHLILATQRPTGAVNENILANTNLRLSLRMLDSSESSAIIGCGDAASLPTSPKGRGLLRVGSGNLVSFQGAISSGPLSGRETPIVGISPLGVGGTTTKASSVRSNGFAAAPNPTPADEGPSQAEAIVDAAVVAATHRRTPPMASPWRPELPNEVALTEVLDARPDRPPLPVPESVPRFSITIGVVDDPSAQTQYPYQVDLSSTGGLLVLGTGGSGKSTTLITAAVSAVAFHRESGSREPLTIMGLDFASRQLSRLRAVPACAEIATADNLEAVTRIIQLLHHEMESRRQSTNRSPVLLLLDDYGSLAEAFDGMRAGTSQNLWLEMLNQVIVNGRQVGIYPVITATRRLAVRGAVMASVAERLVLRQVDASAYVDMGVPSEMVTGRALLPGRGFTGGREVQVATASSDALKQLVANTQAAAPHLARGALPTSVTAPSWTRGDRTGPGTSVHLGCADLTHEPVTYDRKRGPLVVAGDPGSGRSNVLSLLSCAALAAGERVVGIGGPDSPLQSILADGAYGQRQAFLAALTNLVEEVARRPAGPVTLVVDDFELIDDPAIDTLCARLLDHAQLAAVAVGSQRPFSTNPLAQEIRRARSFVVLNPVGPYELQELTGLKATIRPGIPAVPGRGYFVDHRTTVLAQFYLTTGSRPPTPASSQTWRTMPAPPGYLTPR